MSRAPLDDRGHPRGTELRTRRETRQLLDSMARQGLTEAARDSGRHVFFRMPAPTATHTSVLFQAP
jgi:hypothetical protein